MAIKVMTHQASFYDSTSFPIGQNELNLELNLPIGIELGKLSAQEIQEQPLPLSPFTDSDTSSVRRGSLASTFSYSPETPQTPLQASFPSSSNPNRLSAGSARNIHLSLNRISTASFETKDGTIKGDSMPSSPDTKLGEQDRINSVASSSFIPPPELLVRDKSMRLSQTTVNSQSSGSGNKKEGALENWKSWAKEIEARGGRSDTSSRDEIPTAADPWNNTDYSTTTTVTTTTTTTITKPRTPSPALNASPTRKSTTSPSPSAPTSPILTRSPLISVAIPINNPLGPYRKKLSKSLSSGKRVSIEIQLLVELVDTLESYIKSFCTAIDKYNTRMRLRANVTPGSPVENKTAASFMVEILSLLKELIEVAPLVQKCIMDGAYGPLASPYSTSTFLPPTIQIPSNENYSLSSWWPKRFAKDLRKVLEEVGFPTVVALKGGTSSSTYVKEISPRGPGQENLSPGNSSPSTPSSPSSPITPNSLQRKEELMEEGRRRWAAFRKRQQALGQDIDAY